MSQLNIQRVIIEVGLLRDCYGTFTPEIHLRFTPEIQRQINSFRKELKDQRTSFRLIRCKNKSLTKPRKSLLLVHIDKIVGSISIFKQECIPVGCIPPARYHMGVSVTEIPDRDAPLTDTSSLT